MRYCGHLYSSLLRKWTWVGHRVYKSPYGESGEYTSPLLVLTCAHTHKTSTPKVFSLLQRWDTSPVCCALCCATIEYINPPMGRVVNTHPLCLSSLVHTHKTSTPKVFSLLQRWDTSPVCCALCCATGYGPCYRVLSLYPLKGYTLWLHHYYDGFEKSIIVKAPCRREAPWYIATQYCTLEEYTDLADLRQHFGVNCRSRSSLYWEGLILVL